MALSTMNVVFGGNSSSFSRANREASLMSTHDCPLMMKMAASAPLRVKLHATLWSSDDDDSACHRIALPSR